MSTVTPVSIADGRSGDPTVQVDRKWRQFSTPVHECKILICPEAVGFSAYALRLPGVVSEGETIDEAIRNITEAFLAALEAYRENKMEIPWSDAEVDRTNGCFERWILVNA